MRIAALAVLCLAFIGCKKSLQPTVPRIPDSNIGAGGGTFETPEAVMFHTVYRYSGHAGQALAFYAPLRSAAVASSPPLAPSLQ